MYVCSVNLIGGLVVRVNRWHFFDSDNMLIGIRTPDWGCTPRTTSQLGEAPAVPTTALPTDVLNIGLTCVGIPKR